ncbi:MAG TPA: VacB/RNase II family 3'-5' exoribonuclease [Phycisphaerales bacterium]|nr:VacB/RNase II family 3'-5' exoribonuclease [Phycisphaerales bacterium]
MALRYKRRLIQHLQHEDYDPKGVERLAEELRIDDAAVFADEVRQLVQQGEIEIDDSGRVRLPSLASMGGELVGEFRGTDRGFAFVKPQSKVREGDVFIPPGAGLDAMTGDTVRVELSRDKRRERRGDGAGPQFVGEVVEVLERKRAAFTGEIFKQGPLWLVQPDGREMRDQIVVRDAESKNVRPGDKVVVEIVRYPESGSLAEGVISRVLGEAGLPDVETQAVIAAFNLPGEFPKECVDQARRVTRVFEAEIADWERSGQEALKGRRDLTAEFICTIDPPDAKDYDDAISISRTNDGGWELGVHIADVAHFIDPGSRLDVEAAERGNSVYLPRHVIPMLPEVLSNGICSLQEGVPRYAKSAFMRYDKQGNIKAEGAAQTLIKSAKRLTYLEAQALIDGNPEEARQHARTEPNYTPQLLEALREMDRLARAIQGRRQRQGMISLELPEVVLLFDEQGRVIDAEREDDAFTHTLIEMFMVEANEVLARLFERLGVPLIRRVHPEPTPGETEDLQRAAKVAGFTIPKHPTREELQGLLNATKGTPAARAVHMAVLRTLTKAEYSPAAVGHFALASSAYAHFTSPIRRYPDLTVHRSLAEFLRRTGNGENRPKSDDAWKKLGAELRETEACPSMEELTAIGRHCTRTEENAESAERELRSFLVLQLLSTKTDEEFDGVVTGVSPRGIYVQIDKYMADGMVKVSDLPGDVTRSNQPPKWRIDQRTGALVDANSGRSFNMGHLVKVRILSIDLAKRQMDLVLADAESRAAGKAKQVLPKLGGGGDFGGIGGGKGAGFGNMTGSQRRSQKSKSRDKRKPDHRQDRKK